MKKAIVILLIILSVCLYLYAAPGDQTVTLLSWVERRNQEPLIKPVWQFVVRGHWDGDDTAAVTQSINVNGILRKVIVDIPDTLTNLTTLQVLIRDNGDNIIFDSGEQVEGVAAGTTNTYIFNITEPVSGTIDVVMEPSTFPGTDHQPRVTLRGN